MKKKLPFKFNIAHRRIYITIDIVCHALLNSFLNFKIKNVSHHIMTFCFLCSTIILHQIEIFRNQMQQSLSESVFRDIRIIIFNKICKIYLDRSHAYIFNNPCHTVYLFTLHKFPKIGPMFLVHIFSIRSKMKTKNEKTETMTLYA